jgi:hypothetical protein
MMLKQNQFNETAIDGEKLKLEVEDYQNHAPQLRLLFSNIQTSF